MPGTTTHNFILFKALSTYTAYSSLMRQVQESNMKVREYAQANQYKKYLSDDRCLLAGCAYLGCFGPDLFYLDTGDTGTFIADLMHYNRSGPFMIWCMRQVKKRKQAVDSGLRRDLLQQFAYYLGYISHIAADVSVHPLTNSIVSAYPDNAKLYENARGMFPKNIWRFHNIVEHYADAYVLHRRFIGGEKFGSNWQTVNIARAAAKYYLNGKNKNQWFLRADSRNYYRYTRQYNDGFEEDKYRFFESSNWVIDVKSYYESTIPDEKMMTKCPALVQGGRFAPDGSQTEPGLLDRYIDDAVELTKTFWSEVEAYMDTPQDSFDDPQLTKDKEWFTMLRRHWNLDCGIAPWVQLWTSSWDVPNKKNTTEDIAGALYFESSHSGTIDDLFLSHPI